MNANTLSIVAAFALVAALIFVVFGITSAAIFLGIVAFVNGSAATHRSRQRRAGSA